MLPASHGARRKRESERGRSGATPAGRLSALRIGTLAFLLLPAAIAVYDYSTVGFGPRPINDVIHRTGYWALLFLMISLAVTPLRRIARFGKLLDVRRMIGVGAFVYAAAHIALYMADQKYDLWKVGSEIVLRLYLTIGFIALIGLAVLAVTSTDGMVRRLGGKRWQRLHQIVYVHQPAGADPLLPADQGRRLAADLRRRPVRLADGLSDPDLAKDRAGRAVEPGSWWGSPSRSQC